MEAVGVSCVWWMLGTGWMAQEGEGGEEVIGRAVVWDVEGEEGVGAMKGEEEVLGTDEWVGGGEAVDFRLDEGAVQGVGGGAVGPIELEVAWEGVLLLEAELYVRRISRFAGRRC